MTCNLVRRFLSNVRCDPRLLEPDSNALARLKICEFRLRKRWCRLYVKMLCRCCRPPRRSVPIMRRMLVASMTYPMRSDRCRWTWPTMPEVRKTCFPVNRHRHPTKTCQSSMHNLWQVVDVAKVLANCDRRTLTTPPNVSVSHSDAQISVSTFSPRHLRQNVRCRSPSPALAANTTTATKRPLSDGPAVSLVVANLHLG